MATTATQVPLDFPGIYSNPNGHQNPADFILIQVEAAIENWERFGVTTVQQVKVPEELFRGVAKALGQSVKSTMGDWDWDPISQSFISEHRQALTVDRGDGVFWSWQKPFRGVSIIIQTNSLQSRSPVEYAAMQSPASQVSDPGDEQPEEGEAVITNFAFEPNPVTNSFHPQNSNQ